MDNDSEVKKQKKKMRGKGKKKHEPPMCQLERLKSDG